MRISDWSSDVCSSDLFLADRDPACLADHIARRLTRPHAITLDLGDVRSFGGAERVVIIGDRLLAAPAIMVEEIGRASCRERVCPVRVDLGGRRIIKKKKKQTKIDTRYDKRIKK